MKLAVPETGDNDGMDRLDRLENRVDKIDERLGRIEVDVASLKVDVTSLKVDVASVKFTLAAIEGKLDSKVEALRADIHMAISENNKWTHNATIGMFGALVFGILGLLFTIWNASKVQAAFSSPPSIIINVPPASTAAPGFNH